MEPAQTASVVQQLQRLELIQVAALVVRVGPMVRTLWCVAVMVETLVEVVAGAPMMQALLPALVLLLATVETVELE
jgi:hypothetical protein